MAETPAFDRDASRRHRELWNQVARELGHDIRWYRDNGTPHQIDPSDVFVTAEATSKYQEAGRSLWDSPKFQGALRDVDRRLEELRVENLRTSVRIIAETPTNPEIAHLTGPERELIRRLLPAVPVLARLDVRLKDRRGAEFAKYLGARGDPLGLTQFRRLSFNQCNPGLARIKGARPEFCSPVDWFPNERPSMDNLNPSELAPDDITDKDREALTKAWAGDQMFNPYLAPATRIWRDAKAEGGWRWEKINDDPDIQELARIIAHAADTEGLDPTIKAAMYAYVTTLLSPDPYANYGEDAAWVHQRTGNLEVIVGLDGGYSPLDKVHGAAMFVAVERKGAADAFKQQMVPILPDLERRLAERINATVAREAYKSRPIDKDSVVRVVDAIAWPGGKSFAVLAFVGPGEGPVATLRGLAKRIMVANHVEAKGNRILLPLASLALVPEQARLVSVDHFLIDTTAHEMMHPIGPREDMVLPDGARAGARIGDGTYNMIEESKSNVGGLVAIREMQVRGVKGIDEAFVRATQATYVAGVLRQMRFGGKAHGGGAAAEVAWLFQEKAIRLKKLKVAGKEEVRIEIDFARFDVAVEKLWVHIATLQGTGDKDGAFRLVEELPKTIPDEIQQILDRVNAAGIPVDVEMQYPDLTRLVGVSERPTTTRAVAACGEGGAPIVRSGPGAEPCQ